MKLNSKQIEDAEEFAFLNKIPTGWELVPRKDADFCRYVRNRHYWSEHWKRTYQYVHRYLQKNIGRPFDKVQSEILKNIRENKDMSTQSEWESIQQLIRSDVDQCNDVAAIGRYWHHDFYTDEQGILRTWKKEAPAHHKDRVFISDEPRMYHLRKEAIPFRDKIYLALLTSGYGKITSKDIVSGAIPLEQYAKIKNEKSIFAERSFDECMKEIDKSESKYRRFWAGYVHHAYELLEPIVTGTYVTHDKNYRMKEASEQIQKKNRKRSEEKKIEEQYLSTLLHRITEEQKTKERQENLIKIQAHGMDDATSFHGEEYHGEKRKKK